MKNIGFHARLYFAAFLLICSTALILDLVGVRVTKNFMYTRFNDRMEFLTKYLASTAEVSVLMDNREDLSSYAMNLLEEEDVAEVVVYDENGNILVSESREVPGPISHITKAVVLEFEGEENFLFQEGFPVNGAVIGADRKIGDVRVSYSTYGIELLIRKITIRYFWFSFGIAIIAGLVFYLVSHPMVREVRQLTYAARQVGRGDLELRVRPGKIPETRSLALDFNSMLDAMTQSQEALERVNREMIKQKSLAEIGKFSMMIAHEVKNPLSIIKSSLDVLKKKHRLTSKNTMVAFIEDEIRRLNRLIEDFLRFARPMKPNFYETDLNHIVRSLLERFDLLVRNSEVVIESDIPDDPAPATADSDLLVRALGNVFKNGCEAAGPKGVVSARAYIADDFWTIEIMDSGDGIPSEELSKIFEPFFSTRASGTGLGLAFTRQVVRAHGGNVQARNAESGGAVFTIEIPLSSPGRPENNVLQGSKQGNLNE